jgi:membrane protein DedA with SNARE-associated domain
VSEPPEPRRRVLIWCGGVIGILTIASLVGTAFMPYLLARHPLVLVALSPLFRHLVVAAPRVDPVPFFLVAVPRHFLPDPFVYLLGREFGHLAIEWVEGNSPFTGKVVRALERLFARVGPIALLVSPDVVVSTLAGAARVRFPLFVVFNVLGTFITVFVARWFGDVFEKSIAGMVRYFEAHLWLVTVVSVLLVLAFNWYTSRQKAPEHAEDAEGTHPAPATDGQQERNDVAKS